MPEKLPDAIEALLDPQVPEIFAAESAIVFVGLGRITEATLGSCAHGKADANSQYYW